MRIVGLKKEAEADRTLVLPHRKRKKPKFHPGSRLSHEAIWKSANYLHAPVMDAVL